MLQLLLKACMNGLKRQIASFGDNSFDSEKGNIYIFPSANSSQGSAYLHSLFAYLARRKLIVFPFDLLKRNERVGTAE